MKKVDK